MNAELNSRHPIEELAEEFVERLRRGESPSLLEYCDRCPELADEIRDLFPTLVLMERHNSSGAWGEFHRPGTPVPLAHVPEHLADFRIVREVGRGGMGIVYEAEQQMLGRRVALKILTLAASSNPHSLNRFEREARAAARLQHPHIVPVFDVGVADGMHYYAMQFIEGRGLDVVLRDIWERERASTLSRRYSAATRAADDDRTGGVTQSSTAPQLDTNVTVDHAARSTAIENPTGDPMQLGISNDRSAFEILDPSAAPAKFWTNVASIGLQAAEALAHAHEQGIVHRDIKPSNLLLDKRGSLWITDFGLAKTKDAAELTQTGDIVGTLRYMAPEQFRGWSDPRTDVHGLGLTLYELLTLRPAYDALSRAHLLQQITDWAPAHPTHWNRRIPRDLETIVLKAIEKEPSDRYQSAAEMAEDLQRFLDDRPIVACRASTREHFWRWCRRNPVVATLALCLLLAFAIGFMGVFWQWRRAERNLVEVRRQTGIAQTNLEETHRQTARAENNLNEAKNQRTLADASFRQARAVLAELFAAVGEESELDEPSLQPLRKKLLATLLEYDRGFVEQRGNDPTMHAELAASFARVATISDRSGAKGEALAAHQKALEIRQKLVTNNPNNLQFQAGLARTLNDVGSLHHQLGQPIAAHESYDECIAIWDDIVAKDPREPTHRAGLAMACSNLGFLLRDDLEQPEAARTVYEKSLSLRRQLVEEHPESSEFQFHLGTIYSNLAVFHTENKEFDQALEFCTKSNAVYEELARSKPKAKKYQQAVAMSYNKFGDLHRIQRRSGWEVEAWRWYDKGKVIQDQLVTENPRDSVIQQDLANTYGNIGDVHRNVGDRDKRADNWIAAIESYRQAIGLHERLRRSGSDTVNFRSVLGIYNERTAWCLARLGRHPEAIEVYHAAIEHFRAAVEQSPNTSRYGIELSRTYVQLAVVERAASHQAESVAAIREAHTLRSSDPAGLYEVARELALTAASIQPGSPAVAGHEVATRDQYVEQAMDVLREAVAVGFSDLSRIQNDAATTILRRHASYTSLVEPAIQENALARLDREIKTNPDVPKHYVSRAKLLEHLQRAELATADFRQAIELFTRQLQTRPEHFESRFQRGYLYLRLHDYELTISDLSQLLERKPSSWQVWQLTEALAEAHVHLGQAERVIAEYSRIIEIDPKNVSAHIGRAALYTRTKQHAKAIGDYRKVIELKPADPITYNGLAWIYIMGPTDLRSPEAALPLAQKAIELAPKIWVYQSTLGSIQHCLGKWNESIGTMQLAIASNKTGGTAFEYFVMAMSYHKLGDSKNALECYDLGVAWVKNQTDLTADWVDDLQALRAETELALAIVPTSTTAKGDSPLR